MEGDRGKGWGWKVAMVSMDDLDRDTGDVDSQSRAQMTSNSITR